MATQVDTYAASTSRRLRLRVRPDLQARQHRYQGQAYWIVKDPVGLRYFRFRPEEYALLCWLDGQRSLDELRRQYEEEFRPEQLSLDDLQQFLGQLHRNGLLLADAPGQGATLLERDVERRRQQRWARMASVLSIRFRGIDPERLLTWLYPGMRWFFGRRAVAGLLLLALAALVLVTVQFDVFRSRLPAFHEFFGLHNLVWLMVVLAVTKVLHEFGHGLSCKHFGGECHEMGVMLLVFTPCLYCNVSDSWMLPNKWHRAAIGAAGMYVEIVLASLATFVWWFSQPGLLNYLALSTMFVCSVSTIVFNGNPLLRYDGYYILSDVIEIPNLAQKSSNLLRATLSRWCLGLEATEDPYLPRRRRELFALYAVASNVYRVMVVLSIIWFLNKWLEPYRLQVVGRALAVAALAGLIVSPAARLTRLLGTPGTAARIKRPRLLATLATVGLVAAAICLVPVRQRVYCTFHLEPHAARQIYVEVPGRLIELRAAGGQRVEAGQPLAQLVNEDLGIEVARFEAQRDELRLRLASLRQQRFDDPAAALQLPQVEKSLAAVEEQLAQLHRDIERLLLVAPAAGVVIPPVAKADAATPASALPEWHGTPLEERNVGAWLEEGTLLCQLGDPETADAVLVIDQTDIEFVRLGQTVALKLEALPELTVRGQISEIARADLKATPQHLSTRSGGELPTRPDAQGIERPLTIVYQARVFPLDVPAEIIAGGLRGRARIEVGRQTVAQWCLRTLRHTFRFQF